MSKHLLSLFIGLSLACIQPAFAQPDTLWSAQVGGPGTILLGAASLSGGGFAVCGYTDINDFTVADYFVAKLDHEGNVLWDSTYLATQAIEQATAVVEIANDTLMVTGWGEDGQSLTLLGIAPNGSLLWSETYATGGQTKGYDIIKLSDGNLGVLGYRLSPEGGNSDVWLLKCDTSGDTLWTMNYEKFTTDVGNRLLELSNGDFLITANTREQGGAYDFWAFETNSNGTPLPDDATFGTTNADVCYGMSLSPSGDYFISGRSATTNGNNGYLVKIPAAGTPWNRSYTGDGEKQFRGVVFRGGGGATVAGWNGSGTSNTIFYLAAVDDDGDVEWEWDYGSQGSGFYGLIHILSGGNLAYGTIMSGGSNFGYVLRMAPPGGITGTVTEVVSHEPVANVRIGVEGSNRFALTDALGHYSLELSPAGYTIIASGNCVSNDTAANVTVIEDTLISVDFEVGTPHHVNNQTSINLIVHNHILGTGEFFIENSGTGDLYYDIEPVALAPQGAWLSVSPESGAVPPNETFAVTINVLADTTDNGVFDFFGELHVTTNSCPGSSDVIPIIASVLDAEAPSSGIPTRFALHPAYPNPFNPSTTLTFDLPYDANLKLELFDVNGRLVSIPARGLHVAGSYSISINLSGAASGLYLARLTTPGSIHSLRLVLLK